MIDIITVDELAEMLKVTRARVYTLARNDIVPTVRIGRQIRFERSVIEKWVLNGGDSTELSLKVDDDPSDN